MNNKGWEVSVFKANYNKSKDSNSEKIMAICPITKKSVVGKLWQNISGSEYRFPGKQMVWWHCDSCQNWHALLEDE